MVRLVPLALLCALAPGCAASRPVPAGVAAAPGAPPAAHAGAFVVRMGVDTIAVERFARTADGYLVEQAVRTPRPTLFRTRVALTPAGDVARITRTEHRIGAPAEAPPIAQTEATVQGDSATVVDTRGDSTIARRRVGAPPGALPWIPETYFSLELVALRAARATAAGPSRYEGRFIPLLGTPRFVAERVGADSMTIQPGANLVFRTRVDAEGHLLGLHATGSTVQVRLTREPTVDVDAFAARWAQAPAMGLLSPADSVKAVVGGASVAIHYGRPSKRGRVVFGDSGVAMEAWGKVWRTGANEATRLTTDRDLVIGDAAVVPAGTYTLWTLLDRAGWQLIVNKQTLRADGTGRPLWGTGYDARQDLARTRMTMTRLAAPVEQMTILLEPQGPGAVLRVRWDATEASVPVRAR